MKTPTPDQIVMASRIGAAMVALRAHSKVTHSHGEPMRERIVDLVTDLLHLARANGVADVGAILQVAGDHLIDDTFGV